MTPEPMVLEMEDGTEIGGQVSLDGGYLKIELGGFVGLGRMVFRFRPKSAIQVCRRILAILHAPTL